MKLKNFNKIIIARKLILWGPKTTYTMNRKRLRNGCKGIAWTLKTNRSHNFSCYLCKHLSILEGACEKKLHRKYPLTTSPFVFRLFLRLRCIVSKLDESPNATLLSIFLESFFLWMIYDSESNEMHSYHSSRTWSES